METGSVSSIPSSSISNSSARSTPIPSTYKPITPSASFLALTKSPDEDLRRRSPDELLQIIRRLEVENRNVIAEHSNIVKDVNKKMQILLLEVRGMKDINQNLQDDNQELRDLCCFLDDDRQRGRKLAREWQRFGRYTASVMRSEVSAYQEKLKELETKQQELISDNLDLKELCLYLDQERLRASQPRDEGDGSSSSTVAGNEDQNDIELVPVSQLQNNNTIADTESATNDYIRQLEDKVRHLEKEKKKASKSGRSIDIQSKDAPHAQVTGTQRVGPDGTQAVDGQGTSPHKPEAVVHAMKVLEVHENLERPNTAVGEENTLDDKEKAIVREMCNVVWRKLGNVKAEQQQHDVQNINQPPVYENLQPVRSKSTPPENVDKSPTGQQGRDMYYTAPEPGLRSSTELLGPAPGQPPTAYVQRTDNSRGHTVFQVTPSYPPGQEIRRQDEYSGPYPGPQTSQSQRPPPNSNSQGQPPPNPHYSGQQGRYGHVQTSRSTPVTPTPQQQSQHPNITQKMDPRSHSPGPVRRSMTPKAADMQRSHSPGPRPRSQYSRSDSQPTTSYNGPVYQNHPAPSNMGDNSYENVPSGYYYNNQSSQNYASNHNRSQDSVSSNYDYPAPPNQAYSQNPYPDNSMHPSNKTQRSSNTYQATPSQNQRQPPSNQSPPYYQNVSARNNTPAKTNVRDHSPQGARYPQQNAPLPQGQYQSHRNAPSSNLSYSHPSYPPSSQPHPTYSPASTPSGYNTQPPAYSAPPQYQDRRSSYIDARDSNIPYPDRRNVNDYYKK
ncbi:arginine-glutamic acid dipeptide repeats protein-like isoform X2 [Ruditapes philippinarum]|uniref:arginine-glutamic acid dipeptide repeats protein-like isoform X2 n=1 Tax=Ruditapes philippinarum TaxID=129788 RepID=UPI00295B35E4|nr:arginine-glutamic acid dipeptide repeats protein-like isoform X2 [Ruditapes philippinarum]